MSRDSLDLCVICLEVMEAADTAADNPCTACNGHFKVHAACFREAEKHQGKRICVGPCPLCKHDARPSELAYEKKDERSISETVCSVVIGVCVMVAITHLLIVSEHYPIDQTVVPAIGGGWAAAQIVRAAARGLSKKTNEAVLPGG